MTVEANWNFPAPLYSVDSVPAELVGVSFQVGERENSLNMFIGEESDTKNKNVNPWACSNRSFKSPLCCETSKT